MISRLSLITRILKEESDANILLIWIDIYFCPSSAILNHIVPVKMKTTV